MNNEAVNAEAVRVDRDSFGSIEVPIDALYGPQTMQAVRNFPLTGIPIAKFSSLIVALAQIKQAAARVNAKNAEIEREVAVAIEKACTEIVSGLWHDSFPIDILQGGAGTSTNMNMNEVLANRALQLMGKPLGSYDLVNPNDHVNKSQSTNDVYASAIRLATFRLNSELVDAIRVLSDALSAKAEEFGQIRKLGRTQLQDAVPMTLGQEFNGFASTLFDDITRANEVAAQFLKVNLGGTAIGSGIGATSAYLDKIIDELCAVTGFSIEKADDFFGASWDMGAFVLYSGLLKRIACKLSKIANDLRLLSSGPRGGFGEILLPMRQAGSSIMPGKVNPVIAEAVNQAMYRVFGLDLTITFAAEAGQLQLNAFEPVIFASINEAVSLLVAAMQMLTRNCVTDIEANAARCSQHLEASTALATALVPLVGYGRAAAVAKYAISDECTLEEAVRVLEPQLSKMDLASQN